VESKRWVRSVVLEVSTGGLDDMVIYVVYDAFGSSERRLGVTGTCAMKTGMQFKNRNSKGCDCFTGRTVVTGMVEMIHPLSYYSQKRVSDGSGCDDGIDLDSRSDTPATGEDCAKASI